MEDLIQLVFLILLGVILAVQFKSGRTEYGVYAGLAMAVFVFARSLGKMGYCLELLRRIDAYLGDSADYLRILLKVVGITYVCEFGAGICRDAGYQAVASQIEILGKLTVMLSGLPILFALLEQINSMA